MMRPIGGHVPLFLLCLFLLVAHAWAQSDSSRDRLWKGPCELDILLPDAPVEPGLTHLSVEGQALREDLDYQVDALRGRIHLLDRRWLGRPAQAHYRVLRVELPMALSLRSLADLPWVATGQEKDTLEMDSLSFRGLGGRPEESLSSLRSSGSFLRGVRVGSGGQVDMESGLRLQVEGRVGPDVEVEAFLSDRNTPIQPEGRSASLEEVDRIHVQVRSPRWEARLGDVDLALRSGRYLDYRRTVDGLQAGFRRRDPGAGDSMWALAHVAGARGRFHRMEISGQEGVQGPWQLRSEQGSSSILVMAGSEAVWVDGVPMARGEDRDYVMDYALGQLSFTPRRPITGDSRIQVEFQYAERVYSRNLYGADVRLPLASGATLRLGVAGERDDRKRPLDLFLDQADQDSLARAGDGLEGTIWGSGVRQVEEGEGSWRLVDESAGQWGHYQWAEFVPDSLRAAFVYDVRFSDVGRDPAGSLLGDYSRQISSSGRVWYRFEGPGLGAWAPLIALAAPTSAEVVDASLDLRRGAWRLEGEGALSRVDRNLHSSLDDGDNLGLALRARVQWRGPTLGSRLPVQLGAELGGQRESDTFQPLNTVDEVEFQRATGLVRQGGLERMEGSVALRGGDSLIFRPSLSWLRRSTSLSRSAGLSWRWHPRLGFQAEGETRGRRLVGPLSRARLDEARLEQGYGWQRWSLLSGANAERRVTDSRSVDSLDFQASGQGHEEGSLRLEHRGSTVEASLERRLRQRRVLDSQAGAWQEHSLVEQWRSQVRWSGALRGEVDWTRRRVDYQAADSADGVRDVALLDLGGQGSHHGWNVRYQAEQSLAAERLVQYVQVDSLQGSYSRDPVNPELFVPDADGDYVAIPWESGQQRRASRLQLEAGARWDRGAFSGDHQISVEELSRLEQGWRLYLLQPAALQGDSTQSGRIQSRQDLEWKGGESGQQRWRLRWQEERGLERVLQSSSRRSHVSRLGLRVQDRLGSLRGTLEGEGRRQDVDMPGQSQSRRQVRAWRLQGELSRELRPGWMVRTTLEGESARDNATAMKGRRLRVEPTLDGRLGKGGGIGARLSWQQAWASVPVVPFELLGGARVGRTWRGGLDARLQVGKQSRVTLSWQVDALPERAAIQSGRLQVQSFF
jgi:hypothetical protein